MSNINHYLLGSFLYTMRYVMFAVFIACILPVFLVNAMKQPGEEEIIGMTDLASCITAKHVKMFGSDGCGHCLHQKSLFGGDSFAKIDYTDCYKGDEQKERCQKNEVKGFPTWIKFDGGGREVERITGSRTLKQLAEFSNCVKMLTPEERGAPEASEH